MSHFNIIINGERVGNVLALATNELYACFNRRYPYRDCWGKPEVVKKNLRQQCPTAKYEPLYLPKFDAFCAFTDGRISQQELEERLRLADMDGLQNI